MIAAKQQAARNAARWFLPTSQRQLRTRRITVKLARLPGFDRYIAATLTGKPTAIIEELRRDGSRIDALSA
ncbi:MAG: hypothetical protein ACRDTC_05910 [Pseudonocardiaceae bacterium]